MEWVMLIEDSSQNYVVIAEGSFLYVQVGSTGLASYPWALEFYI